VSALIHIAYVSEATVDFSDGDVRWLLERARMHNASIGVTGILLLVGRSFFQILEGEPGAVTPLYEKIGRDKRHKRVVKLIEEPILDRDFREWSMGLARATSKELAVLPGFSDFFVTRKGLDTLSEGLARNLLSAFRDGRFRAHVGD
jgi:hypothetical protein